LALLAGVHTNHLESVYQERLRINPGVTELISACKSAGLKVMLVSGGFTYFAERLRPRLGLDFVRSNQLEIIGDQLSGRLVTQSWGDVCDASEKRRTVLEVCSLLGCTAQQAIAVGDGANDLEMMKAVGLSVAYHAKPTVRAQAKVAINAGGLDRLLEVLH
jgi:phosphoserine phosphatase